MHHALHAGELLIEQPGMDERNGKSNEAGIRCKVIQWMIGAEQWELEEYCPILKRAQLNLCSET